MIMQKYKLSIGSFSWHIYAISLGLLYYLPYYFKNLLTGDPTTYKMLGLCNFLPYIKGYLLGQAKPLHGIAISFHGYLPELQTFIGVLFFIFVTIKFIELIFPSLNHHLKLLLFLLLFCNPYIYTERYYYYQFLFQGLVSILYYYSFYLIMKYKNSKNNIKKMILGYFFPIISLLIGLNFFMPSFFHFVILAMVFILKEHLEHPFKTIKELLWYAKDFLIIVILSSLIYVVEITSLWHYFDHSFQKSKESQTWRTSQSSLGLLSRIFNLYNLYPMVYNAIGATFSGILLFRKISIVNIFLFLIVGIAFFSSYFFYIVLDMASTHIINFPNYYFTFFIAGLVMVKYQNSITFKKSTIIAGSILVVFFYIISFYIYTVAYFNQKGYENKLNEINNYVVKNYKYNGNKIYIVNASNNRFHGGYKYSKILKHLYSEVKYYSIYRVKYGDAFGMHHINVVNFKQLENSYIKAKVEKIRKDKSIYPSKDAVFYYNDSYYVVT